MSNVSEKTLISLAMLKTQINDGKDYLEYFVPFVIALIIKDREVNIVTDKDVKDSLQNTFGLKLPQRIVQLLLKRLSKRHLIEKKDGCFIKKWEILQKEDSDILNNGETKSKILDLANNFRFYCKQEKNIDLSDTDALDAFTQFLSKFSLAAVQLSINGTVFEIPKKQKEKNIILVSQYILNLYKTDYNRFSEFEVLLKGNMIANAVCSEGLIDVPQQFNKTTFFLDTPFVMELYGFDGQELEDAAKETVSLVKKIGGKFALLQHTKEECESLMNHWTESLNPAERLQNDSRLKVQKSEILLKLNKFNSFLDDNLIAVIEEPEFNSLHSIDENKLAELMEQNIEKYKESAKRKDIKSVVDIYQLRKGKYFTRLEDCNAVFVTNNTSLATAIHQYSRLYFENDQVSAVITDFSLANMAWLKAPTVSFNLPKVELLSVAYLSMKPSTEILKKYLSEVEKLKNDESITDNDYLLLTYSVNDSELTSYTLGDEAALTSRSVMEILSDVKSKIVSEEHVKYEDEKKAHQETENELKTTKNQLEAVKTAIAREAESYVSKKVFWMKFFIFLIFVVSLIPAPLVKVLKIPYQNIISLCGWCVSLLSAIGLVTGFCFIKWFNKLNLHFQKSYIQKQFCRLHIDI